MLQPICSLKVILWCKACVKTSLYWTLQSICVLKVILWCKVSQNFPQCMLQPICVDLRPRPGFARPRITYTFKHAFSQHFHKKFHLNLEKYNLYRNFIKYHYLSFLYVTKNPVHIVNQSYTEMKKYPNDLPISSIKRLFWNRNLKMIPSEYSYITYLILKVLNRPLKWGTARLWTPTGFKNTSRQSWTFEKNLCFSTKTEVFFERSTLTAGIFESSGSSRTCCTSF